MSIIEISEVNTVLLCIMIGILVMLMSGNDRGGYQ